MPITKKQDLSRRAFRVEDTGTRMRADRSVRRIVFFRFREGNIRVVGRIDTGRVAQSLVHLALVRG